MFFKKTLPLVCLLLFKTLQGQWAQNFTAPTGVTNITLSAGNGNSASYTFISSGYNQESVYSGLIDGINETTLTLEGFTGTEFEELAFEDNELTLTPHLLRLIDGNADGNADVSSTINAMVFPVIGHVGNEISIAANAQDVLTYFTLYDGVEIIKANTLESLFGVGEDFVGLSGRPSVGDNILIWDSVGWKVYFHYHDKWQTFGTRSDQGGTIVYPDEGMVYVRKGEALTLSFSGYISHTRNGSAVMSYIPGPDGKFLMSNPFPVSQTISQLINTSDNWLSGSNINQVDQLLFWSQSAWEIYYYNGSDWINFGSSTIDDRSVEAGEAFFIARPNLSSIVDGYKKINLAQ